MPTSDNDAMRYQGTVVEWNADRGFGFVRRHDEQRRVFAHVSSFPRHGQPQVGDVVTYVIERDAQGRPRAIEVTLVAASGGRRRHSRSRSRPTARDSSRWVRTAIASILVAAVAAFAWDRSRGVVRPSAETDGDAHRSSQPATALPSAPAAPRFTCAGKRTCPEMTSCAEATFYLRNCSGTLQDGDDDGIPCEDQWCGH